VTREGTAQKKTFVGVFGKGRGEKKFHQAKNSPTEGGTPRGAKPSIEVQKASFTKPSKSLTSRGEKGTGEDGGESRTKVGGFKCIQAVEMTDRPTRKIPFQMGWRQVHH